MILGGVLQMDGMPISGRGQQCSTDSVTTVRSRMKNRHFRTLHALLRTLEKLEGEFRRYVEQSGEGDAPEIGPNGPSEGAAPL